jgi:hypothetical protein
MGFLTWNREVLSSKSGCGAYGSLSFVVRSTMRVSLRVGSHHTRTPTGEIALLLCHDAVDSSSRSAHTESDI